MSDDKGSAQHCIVVYNQASGADSLKIADFRKSPCKLAIHRGRNLLPRWQIPSS